MPVKDYIFADLTISICATCLKKVDAKIIYQNNHVYLVKHCFDHGEQKVLIATDIDYYKRCRQYLKCSEQPLKFNTSTRYGCPYDCGLCPDHEQHSCVTIIEVTDQCNLKCPTCYATSSPFQAHRSLEKVKTFIDICVENEGEPDLIQLSGGEPTIHPQFFEILDYASAQPIRSIMINTNGVRIATDEDFVKRLSEYKVEIHLQFDSFKEDALKFLRGVDLTKTRQNAIDMLERFGISTTLICTMQKGINDDEVGQIIHYAKGFSSIRGVTFQPVQMAGRLDGITGEERRITLTEVRQALVEQSNLFNYDDILPVPCHPDMIAIAYALKMGDKLTPMTRYVDVDELLKAQYGDTINYTAMPEFQEKLHKLLSAGTGANETKSLMASLLCCLPKIDTTGLSYDNVFRVVISQFYDRYNFDVRGVKKSCVHIIHNDGRIIPFDTMNLFYRDNQIEKILNRQ